MFRNSEIHQTKFTRQPEFQEGGWKYPWCYKHLWCRFSSTSSYQILAKTPLIGQYEKSWKGNLNLPSAGRRLQNPSQLGEATQLVKKLNELADYGIHLDSQKKIALTLFLLTIGPALGWVSRSYGHCPKKQCFSFKIASLTRSALKELMMILYPKYVCFS